MKSLALLFCVRTLRALSYIRRHCSAQGTGDTTEKHRARVLNAHIAKINGIVTRLLNGHSHTRPIPLPTQGD